MATAARILDEARFEARARIADVLAIGLLLVVGGALVFNMYTLGATSVEAAESGGGLVFTRDRAFVQAIIEGGIVMLSLAWIVYRLFSRSADRHGG